MSETLKYTGEIQPAEGEEDSDGQPMYPYSPDDDLKEAVNLAIELKRPLLIKGEPGCGKTRLARAVAYELGLPYLAWHIKSTSRALDGLYTYDSVGRLRDAQLAGSPHLNQEELAKILQRISNPDAYIHWGKLGLAFQSEARTVVLIDEVDKADIDFPNDLLLELDERGFTVQETGLPIYAKRGTEPIIFITSNDEKDLPDAFLRRCLVHYIRFPKPERLAKIVRLHFRDVSENLVNKALERFLELRRKMEEDRGELGKKVSTSELLDWFAILSKHQDDEALIHVSGKLPSAILLKTWDDHMRYMTLMEPRTS